MKAVIWTDVFQTLIMLAGMLTVLIKASISIGGMGEIWRICSETGRIKFFKALLCNVPGMFIMISLCCAVGLAMFAYYADCDPLSTGKAFNPNQLLPVFVLELLGGVQGVPGLFVACLFSGALSSVSSMMNSLAAVTWEDFLKLRFSELSDQKAAVVTKVLAVIYGCLGVGVAFLVEQLGGTVLQMSLTFNGAAGAPLVGMFILGACFTSPNWMGTLTGGCVGLAFSMWISIGAYLNKPLDFHLRTSTCGCNTTCNVSLPPLSINTNDLGGLDQLYGLSYLWFSTLGVLTTVVLGLIISYATGPTKSNNVNEHLQLQLVGRLYRCCASFISSRQKNSGDLSQHDPMAPTDVVLTNLKGHPRHSTFLSENLHQS